MQIKGSVALVTGANRGLGQAFARSLVDRGARRVYAAARHPEEITDNNVIPIMLDITSAEQVADAARTCPDVNLLINNAVEARQSPLIGAASLEPARAQMETNYSVPSRCAGRSRPCWLRMAGVHWSTCAP